MTIVLENAKTISIRKFGTLNTATEETKLPIGDSPNMSNVWTDEAPGSVQTAKGYVLAGIAPSGNPIRFLFNFKQDTGTQLAIVSDNATVWTTRDFKTFTSIITGLSESFQLRATTARGKVWFTNGNDSVRTFDGTNVVVLDGTGGTPNVPKGKYITYYHERVVVYNMSGDRSTGRFTALTDSSGTEITPDDANAWVATNEIKIGDGDGDSGTGMFLYNQKLHFFKAKSIWRLEGIDEFSYFAFKTKAEIGPRIQENVVLLDGLMQFVSIGGFYTFDGDQTERISDILNPTSGLGNLSVSDIQSPDTNQEFWIQSSAADFDAGTKSANIDTTLNALILKPLDDSTVDFVAGTEKTNIDTALEDGAIKLLRTDAGSSSENVALNKPVTIVLGPGGTIVGNLNSLTDGNTGSIAGFTSFASVSIPLTSGEKITTIKLTTLTANKTFSISLDGVVMAASSITSPGTFIAGTGQTQMHVDGTLTGGQPGTVTITFPVFSGSVVTLNFSGSATSSCTMSEISFFPSLYFSTGKFVSKVLDLKEIPFSLGKLQVDYDLNAETASFFTQSSVDGIAWDAETSVTPGSAIASTPRRYFRWGINFASDGLDTAVIRKVYGPGLFTSQTFDTASTIFQWKAYQADQQSVSGTILHFYRTATTTGGLSAKSWIAITPGSDIVSDVTDDCVQFKVEMSSGDPSREPSVDSVTVNWITGTEGEINSQQLVHGISWNGRYWTDVSELGEDANNLMLIRGRKTFDSPWQLKRDWHMLALFIFNDALYAGSSTDSNIYKLDTGYSANGTALDSYFETGDMVGDEPDFQKNIIQLIADYEKMGDNAAYNLDVGVSVDKGDTWTEKTISLLGTGRVTKALNLSKQGNQFRFRFRTNGIDQPFIAHGLDAPYRPTKFR